jgi:mycothiol synthase
MDMYSLPQGFFMRRPTLEDVDQVVELSRICDIASFGISDTSEERTLMFWQAPGQDLAQDFWLVFAADGRLVGYNGLGHVEPTRMGTGPRVHPDYAGQGIEAYLLAQAEERARQFISQAPQDARVTLNLHCDAPNQLARQAIELAGAVFVRSSLRMEIDQTEPPPAPTWPEGIVLKPFAEEMVRTIYEADEEIFQDHWGHIPLSFEMWKYWQIENENFEPDLWFLPFEGEQLTSIALCGHLDGVAWVDGLGVRRPWRRKGLGEALLYHAFGEFYRRGERRVGLTVDAQNLTGALRLYTRVGMRPVVQVDQYQKELRSGIELSTQELNV